MNIILVSEDQELQKLCSDILNDFADLDWRLATATPATCPADADLYIWDDHGRVTPLAHLDQSWSKHLFIVRRDEIAKCSIKPDETSPVAILLKPVTRACFATFLELATLAAQERVSAANSLRADRDELLQSLIQSNLQIQRYDQDRTNFLARAVHDFRAPLMTANGYCGLLLSEALGPQNDEQKEVLRRMQHSIKRLSRMASAMFELSIGNHVKREPELRQADIRECTAQALHEITPLADGKRISISVDLENETGPLFIESGQMEQVLINILENACKFTPKGGEIAVRGYPYFWERRWNQAAPPVVERRCRRVLDPNSYRVDICDSGPRIPQDHLARLFEEYTSYDGGADRSGGGLGLAICKMILYSHGGRVWAENSDSGPRFSFVLPMRTLEASVGEREAQFSSLANSNGHRERLWRSEPSGHKVTS